MKCFLTSVVFYTFFGTILKYAEGVKEIIPSSSNIDEQSSYDSESQILRWAKSLLGLNYYCQTETWLQQAKYKGIVGDWPLNDVDDEAYDYTHHPIDGVYSGDIDLVLSKSSQDPVCAWSQFSSQTSDKVIIPSTSSGFSRLEPASVSVELWFKGDSPGNNKALLAKGNQNDNKVSYGIYKANTGGLRFVIGDSNGIFPTPDAPTTVWDNEWHHVVGTFDHSTRALALYIDGSIIGSVTADRSIGYNLNKSRNLVIGDQDASNGNRYFTGDIAGVRIWDRAVSANTVANLYTDQRDGIRH